MLSTSRLGRLFLARSIRRAHSEQRTYIRRRKAFLSASTFIVRNSGGRLPCRAYDGYLSGRELKKVFTKALQRRRADLVVITSACFGGMLRSRRWREFRRNFQTSDKIRRLTATLDRAILRIVRY